MMDYHEAVSVLSCVQTHTDRHTDAHERFTPATVVTATGRRDETSVQLKQRSWAAISGCLGVPTPKILLMGYVVMAGHPEGPRFNQIISNSHRTYNNLRTLSIKNSSCVTNKWLIVEFLCDMNFSSNPLGVKELGMGGNGKKEKERREGNYPPSLCGLKHLLSYTDIIHPFIVLYHVNTVLL